MLLRIPQEAVRVEVAAREVAPGVRLHLNLQAGKILKDIMFQQLRMHSYTVPETHRWMLGPHIFGAFFVASKLGQDATEQEIAGQFLCGPRMAA